MGDFEPARLDGAVFFCFGVIIFLLFRISAVEFTQTGSLADFETAALTVGFAHGFLTLEDDTDFLYKCTAPYVPQSEHSLAWNDPAVGIVWPATGIDPTISDKDASGLALADVPVFA